MARRTAVLSAFTLAVAVALAAALTHPAAAAAAPKKLPPPGAHTAAHRAISKSQKSAAAPPPVSAPATPEVTTPAEEPGGPPLPTVLRSESDLPEPVRAMRQQLIDAAKSGDIERLRALMQAQSKPPSVALGDPGDPIDYLKALSADADGREILAILLEVMQAGFVHVGAGTDKDYYLWPYFADYPLNALTPEQIVELFTLVTAADFEDMKSYGAYTAFRVGIAADGQWLFFLAGD